jgi:hypothetical protein
MQVKGKTLNKSAKKERDEKCVIHKNYKTENPAD